MSWWKYVERTKGTDTQDAVAAAIGVKGSTVSRWRTGGGADPRHVAEFARHYGRPVLEAFVAAEFLTAEEAKQRPAAAPSVGSLSDDQLVEEIRRRMKRGGEHGDHTAATKKPGSGPGNNVRKLTKREQMMEIQTEAARDED